MPLKRMSEFKSDVYSYESPDEDKWEITVVQTSDRKYVEIKKEEEEDPVVVWDTEMLLDIADAVRSAMQKPTKNKSHQLKKPNIIDSRENKSDNPSPSDTIQASVEESMENIDSSVVPVQSFSSKRDIASELEERKNMSPGLSNPEKSIRRA